MIDFSGQNAMRTALAMVLGRFIPGVGPLLAGALMSLLSGQTITQRRIRGRRLCVSAVDQGRDRDRPANITV